MNDIQVVHNGKILTKSEIDAVDAFIKKISERPMWEGVEFLVEVFLKRNPQYKQKVDRSLKNEFGATQSKDMRHLASIPNSLMDLIDYFYADDIKGYGRKKFMREFTKKFPVFAVAERV